MSRKSSVERYHFLMSPEPQVIGSTFPPGMLNESHVITHLSVYFSAQSVFLFSH